MQLFQLSIFAFSCFRVSVSDIRTRYICFTPYNQTDEGQSTSTQLEAVLPYYIHFLLSLLLLVYFCAGTSRGHLSIRQLVQLVLQLNWSSSFSKPPEHEPEARTRDGEQYGDDAVVFSATSKQRKPL